MRNLLTNSQQEWVDYITNNGMDGMQDAINWASNSHWANNTDGRDLTEIYDLLKNDLSDFQFNGAKSYKQASFYLCRIKAILNH